MCAALAGCGHLSRKSQPGPLFRATGGLPPMADVQPRGHVAVPMVDNAPHTVPVVRARLNGGDSFPLVLDSGGNHTMIGKQRADRERLIALGGRGQITTAFGNQGSTRLALADRMELGRLSFIGMPVLVHDFGRSTLSSTLGGELNVLGTPAMAAFSYITFDYHARQVYFSYRDRFDVPSRDRALRLPLRLTKEGHLSAPITFPNGMTRHAIVDTGYDGVLLMSRATLEALDLTPYAQKGRPVRAIGPGAELDGRVFMIPSITLDGRPFPNIETWSGSIEEPLLLGSGLMRYFKATFDFRRMTLWLEMR